MATSRQDIARWFDDGVQDGKAYLIIVCDTFDHDDYPVYVGPNEDFYARHDHFNGRNMQRIMEVYDLKLDRELQLNEHRANHKPTRS